LPDLGNGKFARGALHQAHAQAFFQNTNAPAQFRLRHIQSSPRGGEALMLDDLDEVVQVIEILHEATLGVL